MFIAVFSLTSFSYCNVDIHDRIEGMLIITSHYIHDFFFLLFLRFEFILHVLLYKFQGEDFFKMKAAHKLIFQIYYEINSNISDFFYMSLVPLGVKKHMNKNKNICFSSTSC